MSLWAGPQFAAARWPTLCWFSTIADGEAKANNLVFGEWAAMGDWSCRYDEPARFTPAGFAASERSTDQVNANATKPEQSNTRPATVTARKLLEANSSRMVHLVRPCSNGTTVASHSQRDFLPASNFDPG